MLVYTKDIQTTVSCIRLLHHAGANLGGICLAEQTLHFAREGNVGIVEMILECGGSLDCADSAGKNILHMAVLHGQVDVAKWVAGRQELRFLLERRDAYRRRAVDDVKVLLLQEKEQGEGVRARVLKELAEVLESGCIEC